MTTKEQDELLSRMVQAMFPTPEAFLETIAKRAKLRAILSTHLSELLEDKERLDWLESNNVSMNQLCNRDEVKPYWHLYWTPNGQSHCTHSGNQDAALATLRQAITKAMYEEIKTANLHKL